MGPYFIYSVTQAAQLLKKNPETLRRNIKKGHLVATKDKNGDYEIAEPDLIRWYEEDQRRKGLLTVLPGVGLILRTGIEIAERLEGGSLISVDVSKEDRNDPSLELEKRKEVLDAQIASLKGQISVLLNQLQQVSEERGHVVSRLQEKKPD